MIKDDNDQEASLRVTLNSFC